MKKRDLRLYIKRFLKSPAAYEWQLAIPIHVSGLPPALLISMAKKAARRGGVNWFVRLLNGVERQWLDEATNVKGVDDLETFLAEYLDPTILHYTDGGFSYPARNVVFACFNEEADAKSYWRELLQFDDAASKAYWQEQRKAKAEGTLQALVRPRSEVFRLQQSLKRRRENQRAAKLIETRLTSSD